MKIKTYTPRQDDIQREWFVIDAKDQTLGRLATQVAVLLRGKHKPIYAPHMDVGDFVIIINADKIRVTGDKLDQKVYYHHSGYPGGIKSRTLRAQLNRYPDRVSARRCAGCCPRTAWAAP